MQQTKTHCFFFKYKNALNLENCAGTSVVWPVYVGVAAALALAVTMALAVGSIGFNAVICTVEIWSGLPYEGLFPSPPPQVFPSIFTSSITSISFSSFFLGCCSNSCYLNISLLSSPLSLPYDKAWPGSQILVSPCSGFTQYIYTLHWIKIHWIVLVFKIKHILNQLKYINNTTLGNRKAKELQWHMVHSLIPGISTHKFNFLSSLLLCS